MDMSRWISLARAADGAGINKLQLALGVALRHAQFRLVLEGPIAWGARLDPRTEAECAGTWPWPHFVVHGDRARYEEHWSGWTELSPSQMQMIISGYETDLEGFTAHGTLGPATSICYAAFAVYPRGSEQDQLLRKSIPVGDDDWAHRDIVPSTQNVFVPLAVAKTVVQAFGGELLEPADDGVRSAESEAASCAAQVGPGDVELSDRTEKAYARTVAALVVLLDELSRDARDAKRDGRPWMPAQFRDGDQISAHAIGAAAAKAVTRLGIQRLASNEPKLRFAGAGDQALRKRIGNCLRSVGLDVGPASDDTDV